MLGTIPHPRFGSWTEGLQALFLDHLSRTGQVRLAAAACGLSRQSVYKLRRRDPVFAQKWDDALEHLRTRRAEECAAISADFQRRARELAASKLSPRTV
jgi:hypothetical protein